MKKILNVFLMMVMMAVVASCSNDKPDEPVETHTYYDGHYTLDGTKKLVLTVDGVAVSDNNVSVDFACSEDYKTCKFTVNNLSADHKAITIENVALNEDSDKEALAFQGKSKIDDSFSVSYAGTIISADFSINAHLTIALTTK